MPNTPVMKYERVEGEFPIRHMCQVKTDEDMESFREYRRFVHARWRGNNLESARSQARDRARTAYQSMDSESKAEYRSRQNERRRAKREAIRLDPAAYASELAKDNSRHARWRKENPEGYNLWATGQRHARRAAGKPNKELLAFLKKQPCLDCGYNEKPSQIGHLIPVNNLGTNHPLNLIAQCRKCNRKQWYKPHPKAMMVHYPFAAALAA